MNEVVNYQQLTISRTVGRDLHQCQSVVCLTTCSHGWLTTPHRQPNRQWVNFIIWLFLGFILFNVQLLIRIPCNIIPKVAEHGRIKTKKPKLQPLHAKSS